MIGLRERSQQPRNFKGDGYRCHSANLLEETCKYRWNLGNKGALSGNIFRLLGFFDGDNLVVLNHGFQKKSQKTPSKEIKTAETRKKDYLRRKSS